MLPMPFILEVRQASIISCATYGQPIRLYDGLPLREPPKIPFIARRSQSFSLSIYVRAFAASLVSTNNIKTRSKTFVLVIAGKLGFSLFCSLVIDFGSVPRIRRTGQGIKPSRILPTSGRTSPLQRLVFGVMWHQFSKLFSSVFLIVQLVKNNDGFIKIIIPYSPYIKLPL